MTKKNSTTQTYMTLALSILFSLSLAMMTANAAFSQYNFPASFIDNNKTFNAEFVVGDDARLDRTYAEFMIDFISEDVNRTPLSENQVRIIYTERTNAKDLDIARSAEDLNYGETLEQVTEAGGFDESDTNILGDDTFDNRISDERYTQTLKLLNGEFNYALRDEAEDISSITDGIFYDDNDKFARYTIEFDNPIDLTDTDDLDEDIVGSTLEIMGKKFTISGIKNEGKDLAELQLVGSGNLISIGETERRTITSPSGEEIEIEILIVTEDSVNMRVNGRAETIDLYETQDFDNITVSVIELIDSDRNEVSGFAELLIGGQEITLMDNGAEVQINDDEVNDIYDKYSVTSDFSDNNNGMEIITITYEVEDAILLQETDILEDQVFDAFFIRYDGLNEPDYTDLELTVDDDTLEIRGILTNSDSFSENILFTTTNTGSDGETFLMGEDDDKRLFTSTSNLDLFMPEGITRIDANTILINFSEDEIEGNRFLTSEDNDDQYLYQIVNVNDNDMEIDLDELLQGDDIDATDVDSFASDIEPGLDNTIENTQANTIQVDLREFNDPIIKFENELILDFTNAESEGISGNISYFLDDIDTDNAEDENENIKITLSWDESDDKIELLIDESQTAIVNEDAAEEDEDDNDMKTYATPYGTLIRYNNEDRDYIRIKTPENQVAAEAVIIFATPSEQTKSLVVARDELEDEIDRLEEQRNRIIKIENSSSTVIPTGSASELEPTDDTDISDIRNKIIIGGPAINRAAAQILGVDFPTYGSDTELQPGLAVIRYYPEFQSLLVYGYEFQDTQRAVEILVREDLSSQEVFIAE